jgi:hypothetical protein
MGMASRQRFSGCGESRCAYKLRLSAAIYVQTRGQQLALFPKLMIHFEAPTLAQLTVALSK